MSLAQAVENLYVAFSTLPRPTQIIHKPYELEPGEVEQLLTVPLRELSPTLMRSYVFEAVSHVGTWDDFRYFLPRLLELMPDQAIRLEAVADCLEYAQQHAMHLSDAQRTALHAYILAYWDDLLAEGSSWWAERHLGWGTLEAFGVRRTELLARWRIHPMGALALADVLRLKGQGPSEWPLPEVIAWLEEAFHVATDDTEAQLLSDALLMLGGPP